MEGAPDPVWARPCPDRVNTPDLRICYLYLHSNEFVTHIVSVYSCGEVKRANLHLIICVNGALDAWETTMLQSYIQSVYRLDVAL